MDYKSILPPKYDNLFRQIVRNYEQRQYSKGLRLADEILNFNPNHGETLALKGLLLKCLDRSEEGYTVAKEGLKKAITSHVSWHVLGIMYTKDLDFMSATKSYMSALRFSPSNITILRDLAPLQAQLRDYKGLLETRKKLLELKSNQRVNWFGYALAHHLNKNYDVAVKIIDAFLGTEDKETLDNPYEMNEIFLYKAFIMIDAKEYEKALRILEETKDKVLDKMSWLEYQGEALLNLKRLKEARQVYLELLKLNSENHKYLASYQKTMGLSAQIENVENPKETEALLKIYDELAQQFPDSMSIKRIPLNFATGEEFEKRLLSYVKPYIKRTIPSLFSSLKALYLDQEKVAIIEKVFLAFLEHLEKDSKLTDDEEEDEAPSAYLWVLIFLAYHFDKLGHTKKALEFIDKAIGHTPTVVELYLCKGRIYKHGGDVKKASECVDLARRLDLADRYLNTKATKYMIRAGDFEKAEKTISLFAKQQNESEHPHNLYEMQCMWFENESGDCFFHKKDYGRALKQFKYVSKHFDEISDDQYDFHGYSLRKLVLRAYVDVIRFEDRLRSHKFFFHAACGLLRTYIILHDIPPTKEHEPIENQKEADDDNVIDVTKKKKKKKDDDPFGKKLLYAGNYLEEATKYLNYLEEFSSDKIETQELGTQIYLRKNKYLLLLRCIHRGRKLQASNPTIHKAIVQLFDRVEKQEIKDETVLQVIQSEKKALFGVNDESLSVLQFNQKYISENADNLACVTSGAEMIYLLDNNAKNKAIELILETAKKQQQKHKSFKPSLKEFKNAYSVLKDTFQDNDAAENFRCIAHDLFPIATLFHEQQQ